MRIEPTLDVIRMLNYCWRWEAAYHCSFLQRKAPWGWFSLFSPRAHLIKWTLVKKIGKNLESMPTALKASSWKSDGKTMSKLQNLCKQRVCSNFQSSKIVWSKVWARKLFEAPKGFTWSLTFLKLYACSDQSSINSQTSNFIEIANKRFSTSKPAWVRKTDVIYFQLFFCSRSQPCSHQNIMKKNRWDFKNIGERRNLIQLQIVSEIGHDGSRLSIFALTVIREKLLLVALRV